MIDSSKITEDSVIRKYNELPTEVRDLLDSARTEVELEAIAKEEGMGDEESFEILKQTAGIVLLGFLSPTKLASHLKEVLVLEDEEKAKKITTQLRSRIFNPVNRFLARTYPDFKPWGGADEFFQGFSQQKPQQEDALPFSLEPKKEEKNTADTPAFLFPAGATQPSSEQKAFPVGEFGTSQEKSATLPPLPDTPVVLHTEADVMPLASADVRVDPPAFSSFTKEDLSEVSIPPPPSSSAATVQMGDIVSAPSEPVISENIAIPESVISPQSAQPMEFNLDAFIQSEEKDGPKSESSILKIEEESSVPDPTPTAPTPVPEPEPQLPARSSLLGRIFGREKIEAKEEKEEAKSSELMSEPATEVLPAEVPVSDLSAEPQPAEGELEPKEKKGFSKMLKNLLPKAGLSLPSLPSVFKKSSEAVPDEISIPLDEAVPDESNTKVVNYSQFSPEDKPKDENVPPSPAPQGPDAKIG